MTNPAYTDLQHFYRDYMRTIAFMRKSGEDEWAEILDTARFGNSANEVVPEIKIQLKLILKTDAPKKLGLEDKFKTMLRFLVKGPIESLILRLIYKC